MKIQFRIRGLNANASLRAWLEKQLERLHSLIPVSTAEVVLERERSGAPAFRAHVHLAVPSPDIHAEARDHTLEAVWLKVAKKIAPTNRAAQIRSATPAQRPRPASVDGWPLVCRTGRRSRLRWSGHPPVFRGDVLKDCGRVLPHGEAAHAAAT